MMKTIKGNLLTLASEGNFDIIVQGCNCFNTFGSGLAKDVKEQYPNAYEADCATRKGDYNKLGNYSFSFEKTKDNKEFIIINAYTQYDFNKFGSEPVDKFEYESFELILKKLLHNYGDLRIGLPALGMGLAGGNKQIITTMMKDFAIKVAEAGGEVTLVLFD